MEAKIVLSERKVTTIQEQSGIRFEPRDLTATHPDDPISSASLGVQAGV